VGVKQTEALKLALEGAANYIDALGGDSRKYRQALAEQPAQRRHIAYVCPQCHWSLEEQPAQQQEPVTVLPDGSAFAVMSYPLPKDHWLYADRQYNEGEYEPVELGKPVLTHELRNAVVSAVRYAIRGATNCGKEVDFDPDALVQNAVYALCGPFTSPPASKPWVGLTNQELIDLTTIYSGAPLYCAIEAKLKEKNA
jgi:hypothetical protein